MRKYQCFCMNKTGAHQGLSTCPDAVPSAMTRPLPELVSYLEDLPEPHILFDRQYRILAANAAYRRQFAPPGESVIGRTCYEVSHHFSAPCDQSGEHCPLMQARQSGQREKVLHVHHTPRGEAHVDIELTPLLDDHGEQAFYIERMRALNMAGATPEGEGLIGRSEAFRHMLSLIARVAPSNASVLLQGESGTGKELVTRAIHEASARRHRALVAVDCASLSETLFESELFGHERGAFTGANTARTGLVESAAGGTLFLDELGDIPMPMQIKLLRLLESGTYRRVGSTELRHADIRVVAATHRDVPEMVKQGRFREDLYYRLNTFPIHLPPLRERLDDVDLLCQALLHRLAPQRDVTLAPETLQQLRRHDFPGNVRELRNLLERALLLCDGHVIQPVHLHIPERGRDAGSREAPPEWTTAAIRPQPIHDRFSGGGTHASSDALTEEKLLELLAEHRGNRSSLAARLGISERTLYRRMAALPRTAAKR